MRQQVDWRPVLAVMALSPQQKRATADARAALGAWFLLQPQCMEPAACVAILELTCNFGVSGGILPSLELLEHGIWSCAVLFGCLSSGDTI